MRRLLLVAGLLLVTACDDPNLPGETPVGEMSATLGGAISEQYDAKGRYPGSRTGRPVTFAAAQRGPEAGMFAVGGWRARDPELQDALMFELRGVAEAGVYPLTGGVLNHGRTETDIPRIFRITSGEATIHLASEDRLQGAFHAIAVEMVPPVGGPEPDTVSISEGTFDVPIVVP